MARSPQNFKLIRESDGVTFDMDTINVIVKSLKVNSPHPIHTRETIDNRHGYIHFNTTYGYRKLDADIRIFPEDNVDFELFRNELFKSLNALESFHLIRDIEPAKRIKVYLEDSFSFNRDGIDGETSISFTSPSPFWESIGTTLDPFTFDSDLWQIGQGLTVGNGEKTTATTTWAHIGAKKWSEI